MTRRQRIPLLIGVGLIFLCLLYPPYQGVYKYDYQHMSLGRGEPFIGYFSIFAPPSDRKELYHLIFDSWPYDYDSYPNFMVAEIDFSRLFLQILLIAIAAGTGIYLTKE